MRHAVSPDREARRIRRASFLLCGILVAAGVVHARFDRTQFTVSASVPAVCEVRTGTPAAGDQASVDAPVDIRCTHDAYAAVTMTSAPDRGARREPGTGRMQPVAFFMPETGPGECEFIVVARGLDSAVQLVSSTCSRALLPAFAGDGHVTAIFRF